MLLTCAPTAQDITSLLSCVRDEENVVFCWDYPEGKVVYTLRRPWRDGTTHIVFDPLTFIERLAALVSRPRVHLSPTTEC